jgi:hypothetical protein
MRTSGSSTGGRLGLPVLFLMGLVGVAVAAESLTAEVPDSDTYIVAAAIVPGCEGAEVLGDKGDGHVDFHIGFGVDLLLSVNGVDAGPFDPSATYSVTVSCQRAGQNWFASTVVVNECTGEVAYSQANYKMPGAAELVRATAPDVIALSVQ